jgi:periplasmic protein TonB
MFEQAALDTRGALRSPWALTVSVLGQTLVIGTTVLVSLIHTDALPRSLLSIGLVAPGVPAGPPPRPSEPTVARPTKSTPHPFTAPATIPRTIDLTIHEAAPAASSDSAVSGYYIEGGVGAGTGGLSSVLMDAIRPPAPAPPPAEPPAQARPAAAIVTKPIPVSSGVQAAKLIRQVNPVYPQLAISARISGTVRLVAIIGRDGAIKNLQVTSGHPLLTPAAVAAVKQWLYSPTMLNNEPVEVITQVDVNFTLSR